MEKNGKNAAIRTILGLLIIFGVWYIVKYQCLNLKALTPAAIKDYIESFGNYAAVVYIAAYVFNTISISPPIEPLSVTAGVTFGPIFGAVYLMTASMIATTCVFFISRFFGRATAEKILKGKFRSLGEKLERNGFMTVLFFRIVHIVPYGLLNYAIGLTRIRFREFFFATFFGLIPQVAIAAFFGGSLGEIKTLQDMLAPKFLIPVGLMVVILAVPVVYHIIKGNIDKKKANV